MINQEPTDGNGEVWPPAPQAPVEVVVPFKTQGLVIEGALSDFRSGTVKINKDGFGILGRRVPNSEFQAKVLGMVFLLNLVACIFSPYVILLSIGVLPIMAGVLELLRTTQEMYVPWEDILYVSPALRHCICIAYRLPSGDVTRTFTLVLELKKDRYEYVLASIEAASGHSAVNKRSRVWTSTPTKLAFIPIMFCLLLLLILIWWHSITG